VRAQDEVAISPKIGVTYRLNERFNVYGQHAHGFRAPPYDTANFGSPTASRATRSYRR
jgi:hemoglobin/transferrin/lactoferrin receptor protein